MHAGVAEKRVTAHAVARCELGTRQGSAQKRLGGAAAALVIVVRLTIASREPVVVPCLAVEDELREVKHLALLRRTGQRIAVKDLEAVGSFHLALEVDVVTEDARELGDDVVRYAVVLGGG